MQLDALSVFERQARAAATGLEIMELGRGARDQAGHKLGRFGRYTLKRADPADMALVGAMVAKPRRRLANLWGRLFHQWGWFGQRQKLATNSFIHAVEQRSADMREAQRILQEEGIYTNKPLSAKQVLRVCQRFEWREESRQEWVSDARSGPGAPRKFQMVRGLALRLKNFIKRT